MWFFALRRSQPIPFLTHLIRRRSFLSDLVGTTCSVAVQVSLGVSHASLASSTVPVPCARNNVYTMCSHHGGLDPFLTNAAAAYPHVFRSARDFKSVSIRFHLDLIRRSSRVGGFVVVRFTHALPVATSVRHTFAVSRTLVNHRIAAQDHPGRWGIVELYLF